MKRAVILHGTDASPDSNWFPWLEEKLQRAGYKVWVPSLPGNHAPDREMYNNYLFTQDWDFADTIVIGHSSGAVSILNLLMDERCPKIKFGIMVSAWDHGTPSGMDGEQFTNLFPPNGFEFELIKRKAEKLLILHGEDDPYCPLAQAEYLSEKLCVPLTIIPEGKHLGANLLEFTKLWEVIEPEL